MMAAMKKHISNIEVRPSHEPLTEAACEVVEAALSACYSLLDKEKPHDDRYSEALKRLRSAGFGSQVFFSEQSQHAMTFVTKSRNYRKGKI